MAELAGRRARQEMPLLAAVLAVATVLRAGWPRVSEFKFSEARLEALALELTRFGRVPLVGVPSSAGFDHSPLSVYLYVPAFAVTSDPIVATAYGGLVNVAAVALCWHLARRWPGGGRWAAAVSALLFAVSPWGVAFSRKIWQVAFVPLLALGFVGLVVSALVEGRAWRLAWAVAVYGVLVQVHPSAIALAPAVLLWLILFRRKVQGGPLAAGVALSALTAVPFLVHQVQTGWPAWAALRSQPAPRWDASSVRLAWETITGRGLHALAGDAYPLLKLVPSLGWTFNLLGWMTVAAALYLGWEMVCGWQSEDARVRGRSRIDAILISWLVIPILFNLRSSLDLHLHFFAVQMPCAWMMIGRAAPRVLQSFRPGRRWPTRISLALLGCIVVGQVTALAWMGWFVTQHDTHGGFGRPLGQYLDVVEGVLSAATQEQVDEILVVGLGDSPVVDETPAIFDVLLRRRVAVRFVDRGTTAVFPAAPARAAALLTPASGRAERWYAGRSVSDLGSGYRLVVLDGSWPQEQVEPVAGPRTLANGVEIQGYALEGALIHGSRAQVWLLWQVLWLAGENSHFSVQAFDERGQKVSQADGVGYPVDERRKGDRILSRFDISLPDGIAGEVELRAGMYRYPSIDSVDVIDQAGRPVGVSVVLAKSP